MQRSKQHKRPLLPSIAIVGDGYTEQIYFDQLKRDKGNLSFIIYPELPENKGKGGGFMKVLNKAKELKKQGHDTVYCLVDMDVVYNQNKTEEYRRERQKAEKQGVAVIECHPCFEIWILLHYDYSTQSYSNCKAVENRIKGITELSSYSKNKDYQIKLYNQIRGRLSMAISNAQKLEEHRSSVDVGQQSPKCEVYRIIERLLPDITYTKTL